MNRRMVPGSSPRFAVSYAKKGRAFEQKDGPGVVTRCRKTAKSSRRPRSYLLNRQYRYQCGYCGVTETDCGGTLTVDHFRPVSHGGDESDDNLVYACFKLEDEVGMLTSTITGLELHVARLERLLETPTDDA